MSRLRITAVTLTLSPRSASSMTFVPKLPDKLTIQSQQVCAQFDSDFWFWDKVTNHCSAAHLRILPKSQQKLIPVWKTENFRNAQEVKRQSRKSVTTIHEKLGLRFRSKTKLSSIQHRRWIAALNLFVPSQKQENSFLYSALHIPWEITTIPVIINSLLTLFLNTIPITTS